LGHFRLVREALRERAWWLSTAPHLTRVIELTIPLYRDSPRRWIAIKAGLTLYDMLAGSKGLGRHRWLARAELMKQAPSLKEEGLTGGFVYRDAQMDDRALGLWAAQQARTCGVTIHEHAMIERISAEGFVTINGDRTGHDSIINAAGPWSKRLLGLSGLASQYDLDLVRGSHLIIDRLTDRGYLLQVMHQRRVCFALPYKNTTLIGTTEVRQTLDEPIACSESEALYLLAVYNHYFRDSRTSAHIVGSFAGLRPLIRSQSDPARVNREYAIERQGRLINVFGGKWTTSRALAQRVCALVERIRLTPQ